MKNLLLCIICASALLLQSCGDETNCTAGLGGNLTVAAQLKHHTLVIENHAGYPDTVFVKFNTQDLPGTSPADYDTFFVGEAGEDHVHMAGLKCGDYFLYAAGFDSTINERVTGGIPFSTAQEDGEVSQVIPVTE